LVASCRFQQFWLEADAADLKSADGSRRETWRMCESASYELIEYAEENGLDEQRKKIGASARRLGLCFAQQMLADDKRKVPRSIRVIIDSVITEALSDSGTAKRHSK
jgi:hypothetical protein